jgi:hypothetical protein
MSQTAAHKRYLRVGVLLMVSGVLLSLAAAFVVHLIGLPTTNSFGVELYPAVPRGWLPNIIAQTLSLTGVLIAMAGATLAFLYKRELTWARATIGAFLFTALMMILFGVIPNEFLTLTQSTLDWSGLKQWITIPKPLVLGNDVSISAAAIKDLIGQGYVITVTGAVVVAMWKWQDYQKKLAEEGPPPEVSKYGRPISKVER